MRRSPSRTSGPPMASSWSKGGMSRASPTARKPPSGSPTWSPSCSKTSSKRMGATTGRATRTSPPMSLLTASWSPARTRHHPLRRRRNCSVFSVVEQPVICPICEDEFRATGATWLGAFRPPDLAKSTENETRQWATDVAKAITNRAQDPDEEAPDGSPIQDPSPAPNLAAADTANSAESHLMVEQEHLDTDDLFHLLAEVIVSGDNKVGSTLP